MMKHTVATVAVALLAVACGDSTDDDAAASTVVATTTAETAPPSTAPAPTTTATTTTTTTTTTTMVTTTTVALSRETEVAVRRCIDSWALLGLFISTGSFDEADESSAACDEAQTQLDVDDTQVARDIAVIIAEANLEISIARVETFEPEGFTADAAAELDSKNTDRAAAIEALIP